MLHKPDAAYLTQTGRGYLQVGNDEVYEQFQSGWSGAVYDAEGGSSKTEQFFWICRGVRWYPADVPKARRRKKQCRNG